MVRGWRGSRDSAAPRLAWEPSIEPLSGGPSEFPTSGEAAARARRLRAASVVALILAVLLALEGIPALPSLLAPAPSAASPSAPVASNVLAASTPAPAAAQAAMSPTQRASLCLLGALPGCGTSLASSPAPAVNAADPSSSWVNVTNLSVPTPGSRYLPSMVFSPADHGDILFGGYGQEAVSPYAYVFYQDTWLLSGTTWTQVVSNTSCTASTCPSPRAGAMIASLGTSGVLLYGGYDYVITFGGPVPRSHGDTWLFSHGHWSNITATAGTAPPARFDASMAYDSQDNLVLLFGGEEVSGTTLGDTWTFSGGTWTNITATAGSYTGSTAPEPRAGAAMGASPDGHILMYGGEDQGTIISNYCGNGTYFGVGLSAIAWWFYQGVWTRVTNYGLTSCPPAILQKTSTPLASSSSPAVTTTDPPSPGPPCGREFAALGWSKNNNRFVLYGGYGFNGTPISSLDGVCSGTEVPLNDTWMYAEAPGGGFDFLNVTDAGDPPARMWMGYAGDLSSGYFVVFGGDAGSGSLRETWRFFELVHARLTGPATIDTSGALSFLLPFQVTGFGGSSNLTFAFSYKGLKTPNTLSPTGDCALITSGAAYPLPYDGVDKFFCSPTAQSYNIYRATVHVVDINNASDNAYANWTFTVLPPEGIYIYSEYVRYFYVGFDFSNNFTVFAEVLGAGATTLTATLGGLPLGFVQRSSDHRYWDAIGVEMAHVSPGSVLAVTADFSDWTLNATLPIHMIDTPDWLQTIYAFPYGDKETTTKTKGPYNGTYSVSDTYDWNIGKTFNFSIPVPLVSGNYSLVPSISLAFGWDSTGNVSMTGTFTLKPPAISLGVFSLQLSAALSLKGTFALQLEGPDIQGIQWLSAVAKITIAGDFSGSIPIYGFSFDLLGQNISIGFTLELDVKPSVALSMLLAPTTDTTKELISGIGVMMKQLIASFKLALTAAVKFSIGIASVEFGGNLALALAFNITPSFAITGGTITGDIFVGASFLFWSAQWDLVGPGAIYSWGTGASLLQRNPSAYNNGSGAVWTLMPRYYHVAGYDAYVWNGTSAQGTAISDVYPHADPVAAGASTGAYLFYTDDNVSVPVNQGLTISVARLDADTNQLMAIPSPPDTGYLIARPQAATLPDGSIFVVWDALPVSEASAAGPQALTLVALHGARYDPWNGTWGPVRVFTTSGFAQSYQVDPTGSGGRVVALLSDSVALGASTPERLVQFDATTGQVLSNVTVTGLASVVSSRGASSCVVVRNLGGNLSVINLADGSAVSLGYTPPAGSALLAARFVAGSASTLALLYRGATSSTGVLFDLATGTAVATLSLAGNVSDLQAIASGAATYVFASVPSGLEGWMERGGVWANLSGVDQAGIQSFGIVQDGSSLLLYAVARTGGNDSAPIKALVFAELGAGLPSLPAPPPASSIGPSATSDSVYLLYIGLVAVADAVALAVVFVWKRRRSPPTSAPATETAPTQAAPEDHEPPRGGGESG